MKIIKKVVSAAITIGSRFIPTRKSICFTSYPDFTDNPYAVFKKMTQDEVFSKWELVWLLADAGSFDKVKEEIHKSFKDAKVVRKSSLKGLWHLLTCRFYICSHGLHEAVRLEQRKPKVINLWHGMPLKTIGSYEKKYGSTYSNSDYLIGTNDMFAEIMGKAFYVDRKNVHVIGQPRNDLMFEETDFFKLYGIDRSQYKSVGIWMPTYKSCVYSEFRIDGDYEFGNVGFFNVDMLKQLDIKLKEENHLLIIKLHPMDACNEYQYPTFSNILVINNKSPKCQVYPMLGAMDYLLTDYSSVFIDYDILKRPMGFVVDDLSSYANSRGFVFDNVEEFLPGKIITNYDSFLEFVLSPYTFMKDTGDSLNQYKDANASQRLLSDLKGFI